MTSRRNDLEPPTAHAANVALSSLAIASPADSRSFAEPPSLATTLGLACVVATFLAIACAVIALIVDAWFAAATRRWLAFPFAGIPPRPGEAASIVGHNLRALVAISGLLLIAQSAYWDPNGACPGAFHRLVRRLGEGVLGAAVAANVIVVGASLGAYRFRMLRAALPHGPFELAAYSLALTLYLQGRERPMPARFVLAVMALSASGLAVAAALETYVNL